jgi:serine/threonine-protein kinase
MPVAEAAAIARQIAEALEAAHERGVIHRDLKPSNIKIRPDGVVKILDFGLAKALDARAESGHADNPTIAATAEYTVVGTPAYMSPEQARGIQVDQQTDIWAFGCVLYEMLTGRLAFEGATSSDTIAAILHREPDYERLPAGTPPLLKRLVKRCLEKDPRRRLREIADAGLDLDDADELAGTADRPAPRERSWLARAWLPMAVGAALVLATALALVIWLRPRGETGPAPVHMTVLLPPGVSVTRGPGRMLSLALSPDGRTLVVAGTNGEQERLYARALDRPEATPLEGTEGAKSPFFSPDGTWIGFFADRRLKRVPAGGGAAVDIAAAPAFPAGASWGADDRIVFAGYQAPLQIVHARGGTPEHLLPPESPVGQLFPEALPDGRTVLFTEGGWTHAFDMVSKRRTDRIVDGMAARYAASGYLLVTRGTALLAAPFDADRLEAGGPALPLIEGADIDRTAARAAHMAVSRAGAVAYVPTTRTFALVLVEPDGGERILAEHPVIENPRFSPDGRRLVVAATRTGGERAELWMHDLTGGLPASRLTSDGGRAPVWSRDGASVTYSHLARERQGIYNVPADGRGDARLVVELPTFHWLVGWTPARVLAFGKMEPTSADRTPLSSIYAFDGGNTHLIVGPGQTWGGRLSPDGRWLAYYANDSGYFEVYVTRFPGAGSRVLIAEGTDPAWSPDGSEIYYRSGSRLMAARLETSPSIRVLSRRLVVEPFLPPLYDDYDIHPNGRTLALVRPAGDWSGREIAVLLDWPATLARLKAQ